MRSHSELCQNSAHSQSLATHTSNGRKQREGGEVKEGEEQVKQPQACCEEEDTLGKLVHKLFAAQTLWAKNLQVRV